jgi:hypothetical protein
MRKVKSSASLALCCAIFIAAMASGLSADTRQSSYQLPSNAQVIEYLLQSVNWYRHVYAEWKVASDPTDLLFLHEHEASEEQIVKLSFEFAKADVALATAALSPQNALATPASADPPPSDLAHFIELKNRNDRESQKAIEDIQSLNEKIALAPNADRKKLKAALDDAQSRLVLLQAASQTVNNLIEFVQSVGTSKAHTGDLDSTINDLAQSMPELNQPDTPLAKSSAQESSTRTTDNFRDTGLLGLASEVSSLNRKLRVLDEKMRLTDSLALCAKNLRIPMAGFITRAIQSAAIEDLQNSDLSLLRQEKLHLDALTLNLKRVSPAIVALDKQKVLLAEYESHLLTRRTAATAQYRQAWKKLVVRLLIVALAIGLLIGMGEISRRLAFRRVQDPNRQRVIGMGQRLLMLFAIAVVALFGVTSDFRSLATYFGFLTAGVAVALQNVIVASLGYLLLTGKRGIRIGDRVQVSAITGDVIDIGLLQFQLREFDVQKQQFTGHVATFSNSLVFITPANGLLKFSSAAEKATDA